jgi:hypothetical protein
LIEIAILPKPTTVPPPLPPKAILYVGFSIISQDVNIFFSPVI